MTINIRAALKKIINALNNRPLEKYTMPSNTKVSTINTTGAASAHSVNTITNSTWSTNSVCTIAASIVGAANAQSGYMTTYNPTNSFSIYDGTGKELVRINKDGKVVWGEDVTIDDAAMQFSRSLNLGAEISVGINYRVRQEIRDAVFEELIDLVNTKGNLTADDLTYLHQAAKIMDKLKGVN